MSGLLAWLAVPENLALLGVAWTGLIGVAQVVVRITPNDTDDKWVGRVALFNFGKRIEQLRNLLTGKWTTDARRRSDDVVR